MGYISTICATFFSLSKNTNCSTICQLGCDSLEINTVVELLSHVLKKARIISISQKLLSGPIDISNAIELGYNALNRNSHKIFKFIASQMLILPLQKLAKLLPAYTSQDLNFFSVTLTESAISVLTIVSVAPFADFLNDPLLQEVNKVTSRVISILERYQIEKTLAVF